MSVLSRNNNTKLAFSKNNGSMPASGKNDGNSKIEYSSNSIKYTKKLKK